MRTYMTEPSEVCVYSDWDDERTLKVLKHVLDHHRMPPGMEDDEPAALAARLVYVRPEPDGGHSVHMSILGEIFFCDLVCRKNGEN